MIRAVEVGLRVAGTIVAVWAGALLAFAGSFWTPYRVGTVLVPVSILLAIAGNAALVWFTLKVTGNRFLALLPGIVWFVLSFLGAERTTEGDLVLYNWVATVYIYAGAITVGVAAYRIIVVPLRS